MAVLRVLAVLGGGLIVLATYFWAMRVLIVKGTDPPPTTRLVFLAVRTGLDWVGRLVRSRGMRHQIWSLFVPVSLLAVIGVSLVMMLFGYTLVQFGVSSDDLAAAYIRSALSLSVLGFSSTGITVAQATVALLEALTVPVFGSLLIAYLASISTSFSQRQAQLRAAEALVGQATTGPALLTQAATGPGLAALAPLWTAWTTEFAWIEASANTVEGYLLLYSPATDRVWAEDALAVLDAANLHNVLLNAAPDMEATRCLAAGTKAISLAAARLAGHDPTVDSPAPPGVTREMFDAVASTLIGAGPAVPASDAAWERFNAARAAYAGPAGALSRLTVVSHDRT